MIIIIIDQIVTRNHRKYGADRDYYESFDKGLVKIVIFHYSFSKQ